MPGKDDYKIDFTDIVSMLFSEQKPDKTKQKATKGDKNSQNQDSTEKNELSVNEEELLKQFEAERELIKKEQETKGGFAGYLILDREKYDDAITTKEDISQSADQAQSISMSFSEIIAIIQLFARSQQFLFDIMAKTIKRKEVKFIFYNTLKTAIEKNIEVLKKVDYNQYDKVREDGTINTGRMLANINLLPESGQTKIINVLNGIFSARLDAFEVKAGGHAKNRVIMTLRNQIKRIAAGNIFTQKVNDIFCEFIIPVVPPEKKESEGNLMNSREKNG